jgi:hypothetical protein
MFSIHNYKHYENTNWFKMQNINRHRYPLCCFLPVRQLHKDSMANMTGTRGNPGGSKGPGTNDVFIQN